MGLGVRHQGVRRRLVARVLVAALAVSAFGSSSTRATEHPSIHQRAGCDVPDSEVALVGRGFRARQFVYLEAAYAGAATHADEQGRLRYALRMGQTLSDDEPVVHRLTVLARERSAGPVLARTVVKLAATAADVAPAAATAGTRVRWRATGLLAGRVVRARYLRRGRFVASERLGVA